VGYNEVIWSLQTLSLAELCWSLRWHLLHL